MAGTDSALRALRRDAHAARVVLGKDGAHADYAVVLVRFLREARMRLGTLPLSVTLVSLNCWLR